VPCFGIPVLRFFLPKVWTGLKNPSFVAFNLFMIQFIEAIAASLKSDGYKKTRQAIQLAGF
jgi:hypothetical protein